MATETVKHFVSCKLYSSDTSVNDWKSIYTDDPDIQYEIDSKISSRLKIRETRGYGTLSGPTSSSCGGLRPHRGPALLDSYPENYFHGDISS